MCPRSKAFVHSEAVLDFLKDAVSAAPDLPDDDGKPKRKRCAICLIEDSACRATYNSCAHAAYGLLIPACTPKYSFWDASNGRARLLYVPAALMHDSCPVIVCGSVDGHVCTLLGFATQIASTDETHIVPPSPASCRLGRLACSDL